MHAVLHRYCLDCHGEKTQKGGLRLDTLGWGLEDGKSFDAWVKVYDKLRAGEMPPTDKPPPPAGTSLLSPSHTKPATRPAH